MAIYMWREGPGIYHNSSLGLISLSGDGINWITMADKNLGATQVYDGGNVNINNHGNFYQRGNNYGFSNTGFQTNNSQINASEYGPGNYFLNNVFIYRTNTPYKWDSSNNDNLRGATTNTMIARRGPCNEGYHVPTLNECNNIISLLNTWGINTKDNRIQYIKTPLRGSIKPNSGVFDSNTAYWKVYWHISDQYDYQYTNMLIVDSSGANITQGWKCNGNEIRPFANTPVQPNNSWTVLYQPS